MLFAFIGMVVLAVIVPIFITNKETILNRGDYALRILPSVLVFILIDQGLQPRGFLASSLSMAYFGLAVIVLLVFFSSRWSVMRMNHLGWSRGMALTLPIPLVGTIISLILLFKPGKEQQSSRRTGTVGEENKRKVEEMRQRIAQ
ncbi:DUF805 domain-containing protein [Aestuariispira insulae]|uniref:DUF805 domain-containing protein n=1 Tax=Aestuariispira insulae TaxID=1461337 RepID=A0A3D9HPP8_9PROT|nr:DUF805 domain-containing protein [Aestuariispira insulae]RED51467.1 hypothetical protein DFP90_103269 [Aestuariispira insulae]